MEEIIKVHYGNIDRQLVQRAIEAFYKIRELDAIQKKPSTSELLDWIQALMISGVDTKTIVEELPYLGVLIKKNEDFDTLEEAMDKEQQGESEE